MHAVLAVAGFVTDFADQAVVLPLAAVIAVVLYVSGWHRGALVWTGVIVGTFGLMLILKLGFGACGRSITNGEIESPSGHTAAAGVIYGSIFAYFAERIFGRTILTLCVILAVVAVVGLSRILLGAHTIGEVVVGALVGIIAALLLVRGAGEPVNGSRFGTILLPACMVLFLLHGIRLNAEPLIRRQAYNLWPLSVCHEGQTRLAGQSFPLRPALQMPAFRVETTSRPRQGFVM